MTNTTARAYPRRTRETDAQELLWLSEDLESQRARGVHDALLRDERAARHRGRRVR